MASTIRTHADAYKVADHLNNKMAVNGTVTIAGHTITKVEEWTFTVAGEGVNPYSNTYVSSELAYFIIWPNRKAWAAEIRAAKKAKKEREKMVG